MNDTIPKPRDDSPFLLFGLVITGLIDALNMRHLRTELYGESDKRHSGRGCEPPRSGG